MTGPELFGFELFPALGLLLFCTDGQPLVWPFFMPSRHQPIVFKGFDAFAPRRNDGSSA